MSVYLLYRFQSWSDILLVYLLYTSSELERDIVGLSTLHIFRVGARYCQFIYFTDLQSWSEILLVYLLYRSSELERDIVSLSTLQISELERDIVGLSTLQIFRVGARYC